jgi:hypothetical protein
VDAEAFSTRLKDLSYTQLCAIGEVISRFWNGHATQEWEDDEQLLKAMGAAIRKDGECNPRSGV